MSADTNGTGTSNALRPYYVADTFDCGYVAKYKPFQGIVDGNGINLASKLNIFSMGKSRSGSRDFSRLSLNDLGSSAGKNSTRSAIALGGTQNGNSPLSGMGRWSTGNRDKSFREMELADYFNWRIWENFFRQIMKGVLKEYVKHLIQQPFEVAKVVMQVRAEDTDSKFVNHYTPSASGGSSNDTTLEKSILSPGVENTLQDVHSTIHPPATPSISTHWNDNNAQDNSDSEEEINYFQSKEAAANIVADSYSSQSAALGQGQSDHFSTSFHGNCIQPQTNTTLDILSSILDKEGIKGIFRSLHTSFILQFMTNTVDAWFTGFLAPLLNIPDPYFVDLIHSNNIMRSVVLSLCASVTTGLVLLPLELINTRFIITTTATKTTVQKSQPTELKEPIGADSPVTGSPAHEIWDNAEDSETQVQPRSMRKLLSAWKWKNNIKSLNFNILSMNILNSCFTMIFNKQLIHTFLVYYCQLDKFGGQSSSFIIYHTAKFMIKVLQLFIQLPVETIYKNCQVDYLLYTRDANPFYIEDKSALIIKPLVWRDGHTPNSQQDADGEQSLSKIKQNNAYVWYKLKGNFACLWRGWKLGMMSVLCGYGLKLMKYQDNETREVRF